MSIDKDLLENRWKAARQAIRSGRRVFRPT